MSKKEKNTEDWPTEEEFVKDDVECGLADEIGESCSSEENSSCENNKTENLAQQYLKMAQSVTADFENYKKRNEKAVAQAFEDGKKSVVLSILPCADAIDKALEMITDEQTKKGLQMVAQKFQEVLKDMGVVKMESLGKQYDANLHNVLASVETNKPQGEVVQECVCGYYLDNIVIRHAQVIVAK